MIMSGEKLTTLEAEISDLREWITPQARGNLALLEGVLLEVKTTICSTYAAGDCDDFSAFIEYLSSFEGVFKRKIADIDDLVKTANAYINETSQA